MAPTLVASRTALPPEGALRLRPGKAGSAAPAGEDVAPTFVVSRNALPPAGAAGRGSEPASAGLDGTQRGGVPQPGGLQGLRLRPGKAGSAAPAGEDGVSTLFSSPLVQVLPDWQVQGFFGERIYALRPWSAQVPKAVQCLVEHLRESFAGGFTT